MPDFGGFESFGFVLLVAAVWALWSTVKIVPQGYTYHGREPRPLHALALARHAHPCSGSRARCAQDEHERAGDGYSEPGCHHQGQRHGARRRRCLLPDPQCRKGCLRGRPARALDDQPDDDQYPHRHGLDGPRRAALEPRSDQPSPADGRRCGDGILGREGDAHRDQGHRTAARPRRQHGAGR